jgi:hypothetical protein
MEMRIVENQLESHVAEQRPQTLPSKSYAALVESSIGTLDDRFA